MQSILTYFLFQCIFLQSTFIFYVFYFYDWYDFYASDILYVHSIKVKKTALSGDRLAKYKQNHKGNISVLLFFHSKIMKQNKIFLKPFSASHDFCHLLSYHAFVLR